MLWEIATTEMSIMIRPVPYTGTAANIQAAGLSMAEPTILLPLLSAFPLPGQRVPLHGIS